MEPRRKALLILSWITIALGLLMIVLGIASIGLSIDGLSRVPVDSELTVSFDSSALDEPMVEIDGSNQPVLAATLLLYGILMIFAGFAFALIGFLGRRGAKKPRKIVPFMVVATAGVLFSVADLFTVVATGQFDIVSIGGAVAAFAFPAVGVYLAYSIRLRREGIAEGEPLGHDGAEFEDGFNPRKLGFMRGRHHRAHLFPHVAPRAGGAHRAVFHRTRRAAPRQRQADVLQPAHLGVLAQPHHLLPFGGVATLMTWII